MTYLQGPVGSPSPLHYVWFVVALHTHFIYLATFSKIKLQVVTTVDEL